MYNQELTVAALLNANQSIQEAIHFDGKLIDWKVDDMALCMIWHKLYWTPSHPPFQIVVRYTHTHKHTRGVRVTSKCDNSIDNISAQHGIALHQEDSIIVTQ